MRAPGFAALALGAVVALSGVLGMSYRSDAVPVDDPVTSTASDTATTSAPADSDPPSDPPSETPSDPPSSTPPTDHDSGHDFGHDTEHDSEPPSSDNYRALPALHVSGFQPGGISVTVGLTGGADAVTTTALRLGSASVRGCTSTHCSFTGLTAGVWLIASVQSWLRTGPHAWHPTTVYSLPTILFVAIPGAPTISVGHDSFGISGTAAPGGDRVHVQLTDGTPVCVASVRFGHWSCPDVSAPTEPGDHGYRAFEESTLTGAESGFSATAIFHVDATEQPTSTPTDTASPTDTPTDTASPTDTPTDTASPTDTATPTDTPTSSSPNPSPSPSKKTGFSLKTLATWAFTVLGINLNDVHPGDHFTVTGTDLPPGATVTGELHSVAVPVGSTTVANDGSFALPVTVPLDFEAGSHELVMTLTDPSGVTVAAQQPLTVVPASSDSGSGTDSNPAPAPDSGGSPSHTSTDPLGSDSASGGSNILTHGLNSIADVLAHPAKVPAALEIGLVLLIFAVLPGHLLNATLAEQYERFMERRPRRRRPTPAWWLKLHALLNRAPFLGGLALTTVTALLFGFADPRFGFTLASLRLFLGLAIALALVSYLTNAVVSRIMRSRWKVDVEVSLRPLGLILTVVGVVVSRVLDFSPGFLIGLVLGLVIQEKSVKQHAWRAVLLRTGILLGLALLAWLGYGLFDTQHEGGTFGSELAIETLVAITTEAVVGLLIELLPLRLLEGQKLFEKSKVLWGALYLLATFIFVVAVVPWEGNWAELGTSLWTWVGIVVGFGIVATGVYLYFRIRMQQEPPEVGDDEFVPVGEEPSAVKQHPAD
jgi:MFS family permease